MDLTKEAIEKIQQSANKPADHIVEAIGANDKNYYFNVNNEGQAQQIYIRESTVNPLLFYSLQSLVDYIESEYDNLHDQQLFIHVETPGRVKLISELLTDGQRNEFAIVEKPYAPFEFGRAYDSENFLIKLNSQFVQDEAVKQLISFAGNVKEDNARQTSDDGFSQKVAVKRGIASVSDELVPNPVTLKPYRTFVEVDQPASEFIFRMNEGPNFSLHEADGGAWNLKAIKNIKTYLSDKLDIESFPNIVILG